MNILVLFKAVPSVSGGLDGEQKTTELIVNPADLDFLAESAYADACRPGNPRDTSVEEIKELYKKLL